MTPYASPLYFAIAGLYVLLPVLGVRLLRSGHPVWVKQICILAATGVMLTVQYYKPFDEQAAGGWRQWWPVAGFLGLQYALAVALLRYRRRVKAKWPGFVAVALAITPLLAAKFAPLNLGSSAAGPAGNVGTTGPILFAGLSYATLKTVDVLIGIHDGLIKELSLGQYFAFVLFFPAVSSGPIDRYRRFSEDWSKGNARREVFRDFDSAIHHLFRGFFYKFILAFLINKHWLEHVPAAPTFGHSASYMYGYSLYLFFDFAGYSAFAVAFSLLLGIHTPENFQRPFLSRNIKEFWTRWHITLSTWFRDFIYMRFLLTAFKKKWFKDKRHAAYVANFLTFGVMGFWHGTEVHYLVYGVYHACLITGHNLFAHWNRPRPEDPARLWGDNLGWQIAGILLTSHSVAFGFLIFSGRRLW